jgi:hypothetical protein
MLIWNWETPMPTNGEELNEKIGYYKQALEVFAQAGDKKRQADVYKDLGDLYHVAGKICTSPDRVAKSSGSVPLHQLPASAGGI